MKINFKFIFVTTLFILSLFMWNHYYINQVNHIQHNLANNVIRFHVKANSDNVYDQNLKLKVKNAVVSYIYQQTKQFTSTNETQEFLLDKDENIKKIAA